jgi:hypothetical protein
VNQERPLENPRTSTLVICNIALWCIYFGVDFIRNPLGPNPFLLVLLAPAVAVVLAVTTVPQWILHLVLKKKRLHPSVRSLLFFTPSILLVGIMLVMASSSPLLRSTGTYHSPSGLWTLEVFRGRGTLIEYRIMDQDSNASFGPEINFSDVHRWAFFWESDSRLWCHTSDMGTSVWTLSKDGVWTQHWLEHESKYIEEIPEVLFEFLPSSTKRRWGTAGPEDR